MSGTGVITVAVFCDPCGLTAECEVQADHHIAAEELHQIARDHMTGVEDWTCSPEGDRCPSCSAAPASTVGQQKGAVALIAYMARSAGLLSDGDDPQGQS